MILEGEALKHKPRLGLFSCALLPIYIFGKEKVYFICYHTKYTLSIAIFSFLFIFFNKYYLFIIKHIYRWQGGMVFCSLVEI